MEVSDSYKSVSLEIMGNIFLKKKCVSDIKELIIFAFGNTILL